MARIVVVAVAPRRLVSAPVVLLPRPTYVSTFPTGSTIHVVTGRAPSVRPGARPVFVRPNDLGAVTAPAVATVSPVHVVTAFRPAAPAALPVFRRSALADAAAPADYPTGPVVHVVAAYRVPVPAVLPVFRRGALIDDPTATVSPVHVVAGYWTVPAGRPIVLRPAVQPDPAQPGTKPYVVAARPVLLVGRVVIVLPRQDGGPGAPVSTPGGCIRSTVLATPGAALLEVDGADASLVTVAAPLAAPQDTDAPAAAPAPASAATARTASARGPCAVSR